MTGMPADTLARILEGVPNPGDNGNVDADDPADDLWDDRVALARLRDFARSRRCSPWAVLGVAFTRLAAAVPPFVVLPPLVGSHASLNLFVGLVGPSGAGKDAAIAAASDALDVGPVTSTSPGSGEGIAHQFVTYRKPNPKRDDPGGLEQHTTSVLFIAPEVDTLRALGGRQGSTLAPELRKAWTGSELGFAYVDREKRLRLAAHAYRLGLVVGVQPERAGALLGDADAGTPQRFLWLPVVDADAPDTPPAQPAGLHWDPPTWPTVGPGDRGLVTLDVCGEACQMIDAARLARLRGEAAALDAHALLCREKVAALFALLEQRTHVSPDDWRLAGLVMNRSDRTRAEVTAALAAADRAANLAKAHATADRTEIEEERQDQRVARRLLSTLRAQGDWINGSDLRKSLASRDRTAFESAMQRLEAAGTAEREDIEPGHQQRSGVRYRAVEQ
jgi:hypothetical protein